MPEATRELQHAAVIGGGTSGDGGKVALLVVGSGEEFTIALETERIVVAREPADGLTESRARQ